MKPRIGLLLIISMMLSYQQSTGQGIDSMKMALERVHTWNPSALQDSALSHGYNYLAEAYSGNADSLALKYIDSLQALIATTSWNKTEGLWLRARGKFHDRRGDFKEALDLYSQAIAYFKAVGDQSDKIAYTYILKAFVLNNNGMSDACEQTLNEIRPLAEKLSNKNFLAWILDWYGDQNFYSAFGTPDYNKALEYYLQVNALLPYVKNKMIQADNAHGLSGCYLRLGDEVKASFYRQRAIDIAKANRLHSVIFAVYGDLADRYDEKNEFEQAIQYRLLALEYAQQTGWIEMEARAHRTAAYTYKQAGNFEKALEHFEALKAIEDSLSRFQVQEKYHELEVKYESGKKDLQIQKLYTRNLRMWLLILAVFLFSVFLFLFYYRRTNKKLLAQNVSLFEKNRQIQLALTEGQNIERKRMAIELHDNINAKIAATKWLLETMNTPDKSPDEQAMIHRLVESLSDIYEDVRFISHNLVPKDIETKSLSELIGQLVVKLNHNQRIQFDFEVIGIDSGLQTDIKIQAYALIMELVNNILRHSECQHAFVKLSFEKEAVHIVVKDDGKGFDPTHVASGTGLKNLEGRVNGVNGSIRIDTQTGAGTVVEIKLPV